MTRERETERETEREKTGEKLFPGAPLRSTKHFNTLAAKPIIDPSDSSSTSTTCMAVDDEVTSAAMAPLAAASNTAYHEAFSAVAE
jgi:hypothetical protein